jgi:putative transcriptional regulator
MNPLPIANHLRRLRFEHGEMTQEALARAVGITRQTIIALEAGRYAPSLELAMRIARVFGVRVDEVFFWREGATESAPQTSSPSQSA